MLKVSSLSAYNIANCIYAIIIHYTDIEFGFVLLKVKNDYFEEQFIAKVHNLVYCYTKTF